METREKHIAKTVLFCGILIAAGVLMFPGFFGFSSVVANQSPQWTQSTGAGISVPACSSASPTITCSGNQPLVTFNWSNPNTGPGDTLYINYPNVIWSGGPTNGVLTVPLGVLANNTSYTFRNQDYYTVYNDNTQFTTPNCAPCGGGVDGGFRVQQDGVSRRVALEPSGTVTSKMRIFNRGQVWGVVLVDPSDPNASKTRVQAGGVTKALCLLP